MARDAIEMLAASMRYETARAESKAAYERYNYASTALDKARIYERLAEIDSQHEPLASLMASDLDEREKLVAIARYVVTGRKDALATKEGTGGK